MQIVVIVYRNKPGRIGSFIIEIWNRKCGGLKTSVSDR
jgi:hypothetical protein